jgi:uncharacterized membrane protein YeaQ/YmgE (transglycosylase-associated protein family)
VTLVIDPQWAAFIWPPMGVVMGLFLAAVAKERSLVAGGSYVVVGMLGASLGGLITYLLTRQRAMLGGFWTSLVTAALGGLIFLGLWKAWLEARQPASEQPR